MSQSTESDARTNVFRSAAAKLKGADHESKNVLVGFDGFIDEIIHVVEERQSADSYTRVETISDFAAKIGAAAGLSTNMEFFPIQVKLGGNGPILAHALNLACNGNNKITYIGALGERSPTLGHRTVEPIFADFAASCERVITMGAPGTAQALEFDDGKIICGKTSMLDAINWQSLTHLVNRKELSEIVASLSLLCFTNWTELPNFNSLLIGFNEVLYDTGHRPGVFIDLADPARRPFEEIREVCSLIERLQENADVILGLNESESRQIAAVYDIDTESTKALDLLITERASKIQKKSGLTAVVIHPVAGAAVATTESDARTELGSWWIDGPYTPKPVLTTGAGDNFNAGFCTGYLSGLDWEECLCSGVCTSGFYVRNGRSPNRAELVSFMEEHGSSPSIVG